MTDRTLRLACAALFAAVLVLGARPANATVVPSGNLATQTWTPAGNPYVVQGDITVPVGATLTVQAGTIVQFAATDGQAAGKDTARIELTVNGTLDVQGTAPSPVQFIAQVGTAARTWYGIVIGAGATSATITGAQIKHAFDGIQSAAPGTVLSVTNTLVQTNHDAGIAITAGTPTIDAVTSIGNTFGFWVSGTASPTIKNSVALANLSYGVYISSSAGTTTLNQDTVHSNVSYGVYIAGTGGETVAITNTIITNSSYGVVRGDAAATTITYSDVWGNTNGPYSGGVGSGVGTFAANPLYANAPSNLRLTEYSPCRKVGNAGQDIGALPYTADPSPGLCGTLWANKQLTLAGSPYTICGDLTVPAGVTLTVDPGVTLNWANADAIASGIDTARGELIVRGTLLAAGTQPSSITFTCANKTQRCWYGIELQAGATGSTITNALIEAGVNGIEYGTTNPNTIANIISRTHYNDGLYVSAGSATFDGITAYGNGADGVYVTGNAAPTVKNSLLYSNSRYGAYIASSAGTTTLNQDTIHANSSWGVYIAGTSGETVVITNTIITNNSYGVVRGDAAATTITYSDVWGNTNGPYSGGVGSGAGTFAANPLYANAPSNLRLTEYSPCRNVGNAGQDIGALPYTADPSPGLCGTLWANKQLTLAGSPYTICGDLTVPTGVTLTIDPGVTLNWANTDSIASGTDTARGELIVRGTLSAAGTAPAPITFTCANKTQRCWYGIELQSTATNPTITNATIEAGVNGLEYSTTNPGTISNIIARTNYNDGLYVSAGSATFDTITAYGNGADGVYITGAAGPTIKNSIFHSNSRYGAYIASSAGTTTLNQDTIHANASWGVYIAGTGGETVVITNTIITNNSYGVVRGDAAATSITYSDVWGNTNGPYSGGVGSGAGTFASNALYANAPTNLRLTEYSPCRKAGNAGQDIGALPYTTDPSNGLCGTLFTNMRLTAAGSPYSICGDLTVATGVTLTVDPGVTLNWANTDTMASGTDTARGELIVRGTLSAAGTPPSPITFTCVNKSQRCWYGVELQAGSTGSTITNALIEAGVNGLEYGTTTPNTIANLITRTNYNDGLYISAGSATFDAITAYGNGADGVYVTGAAGPTIKNSLLYSNSRYGAYIASSAGTTTLNQDTIHANSSWGVYIAGTGGETVVITNTIITNNSYGVVRGDAAATTITYSDVWGNTNGPYSGGVGSGAGTFAANPLYANAPSNLRLTEYSPCRKVGNAGQDIGALPYTADPSPGLCGTLWANKQLTVAGSPYTICGDLTVPTGVTLTIDPGVTLNWANTDSIASGTDTARGELIVAGTLKATGAKATPILFTCASKAARCWYGARILPGSTGDSLRYATLEYAWDGLQYASADNTNALDHLTFRNHYNAGLYVSAGAPVFDVVSVTGSTYGVSIAGAAGPTVQNALLYSNSSHGVYIATSAGTTTLVNDTIHANLGYGVYIAGTGAETVKITNSIITNSSYGVVRGDAAVTSITYSDVWGNTNGGYSGGVGAGAGTISQNPNYTNAPADFRLQMGSVCIDAGTAAGAPNHDFADVTRPVDGDGLNGAAYDMGAYEYGINKVCGDGMIQQGEACDDGAKNGTYGSCNDSCTGPGIRCGDGLVNGPEQCDDANMSNNDACLNSCVYAACGDGFLWLGMEQCDDANMSNTDACTNMCKTAACGDGFVWQGMEQCDDANMSNSDGCTNMCKMATCGDGFLWQGAEQCDDGNMVNGDACTNICKNAACGDGVLWVGNEQCDDGNMVNGDACTNVCKNAACGDGVVWLGNEQCDDGNMVNGDACLNTCKSAACGDGVLWVGNEQCDDGNMVATDACTNACKNAACGDGVVWIGNEQCDDGNMIDTDACLNVCKKATCGDGIVWIGNEECDDANQNNQDLCLNVCKKATCGDGVVLIGVEDCDDGNMVNGDACLNVCKKAGCGDGVVWIGTEQCDDANMVNTDACTNACRNAVCGDAIVWAGMEECDDGNMNNQDTCLNVCKNAVCGDGVVEIGVEDCDDGNKNDNDACRDTCVKAYCGDGVVQVGVEQCDDGNMKNGDGCDFFCRLEIAPPPDMAMPDLQMPDLQMPDLQMPDLQMPDLQMPDLQMPDAGDDGGAPPDLALGPDLAPAPDLATPPDLARSPDLQETADLTPDPGDAGLPGMPAGCQCSTGGHARGHGGLVIALVVLGALARRRRRAGASPSRAPR